jgi:hypothetical protein
LDWIVLREVVDGGYVVRWGKGDGVFGCVLTYACNAPA